MLGNNQWVTEVDNANHVALSYKITAKLAEVQSKYQKIEIFATEGQGNLMLIDGCVMLTSRDNFLYHEMLAHPVLFTHPKPQNVVIIGGGDCGTLQQVLLHDSVQQVTQIDIDEEVTNLSLKYFPELCTSNHDPRATLLFEDGVKWIRESADASFDVIIIDSTDPIGPGEGLFNQEFYTQCKRTLKAGGIIVQQSESPLFHLDLILRPMHNKMRASGFANTKTLFFPQPCYPSGWWSCTMAADGDLTAFDAEKVAARNFSTKYYNAGIHLGALQAPEFMRDL